MFSFQDYFKHLNTLEVKYEFASALADPGSSANGSKMSNLSAPIDLGLFCWGLVLLLLFDVIYDLHSGVAWQSICSVLAICCNTNFLHVLMFMFCFRWHQTEGFNGSFAQVPV